MCNKKKDNFSWVVVIHTPCPLHSFVKDINYTQVQKGQADRFEVLKLNQLTPEFRNDPFKSSFHIVKISPKSITTFITHSHQEFVSNLIAIQSRLIFERDAGVEDEVNYRSLSPNTQS